MNENEYKEEQLFGGSKVGAISMYSSTVNMENIKRHIDQFGEEYTRRILDSHFNPRKTDLFIHNAKSYERS